VGDPLSFEVALPPAHPGSAPFAIFGVLGTPGFQSPFSLPFGLGTMSFLPCAVAPGFQPFVFTLADNVGLPCPPVLTSTPAPWSSGIVGSIPFPVTFALQGVIVTDTMGGVGITNAVVVRVQ